MSGHTAWKAGGRILVEAIVESVFDGVSNWPVKLLLDNGNSETIDASRNVHYSAIHPLSALADSHADLVKALEGALVVIESFPRPTEGLIGNELQAAFDKRIAAIHAALATLTARKVG